MGLVTPLGCLSLNFLISKVGHGHLPCRGRCWCGRGLPGPGRGRHWLAQCPWLQSGPVVKCRAAAERRRGCCLSSPGGEASSWARALVWFQRQEAVSVTRSQRRPSPALFTPPGALSRAGLGFTRAHCLPALDERCGQPGALPALPPGGDPPVAQVGGLPAKSLAEWAGARGPAAASPVAAHLSPRLRPLEQKGPGLGLVHRRNSRLTALETGSRRWSIRGPMRTPSWVEGRPPLHLPLGEGGVLCCLFMRHQSHALGITLMTDCLPEPPVSVRFQPKNSGRSVCSALPGAQRGFGASEGGLLRWQVDLRAQ